MSSANAGNSRTRLTRADDFKSVARTLGGDDDKATFEAKRCKIAKAKPTRPSKDNKSAWAKLKP